MSKEGEEAIKRALAGGSGPVSDDSLAKMQDRVHRAWLKDKERRRREALGLPIEEDGE